MQDAGAYIEQVPAGAKPPALRITPTGKLASAPTPAAGLYVRIADARTQAEAIRDSLTLAEQLGVRRPRFIRGDVVQIGGRAHILLFAGPFTDAAAARAFCEAASAQSCVTRDFAGRDVSASAVRDNRSKR